MALGGLRPTPEELKCALLDVIEKCAVSLRLLERLRSYGNSCSHRSTTLANTCSSRAASSAPHSSVSAQSANAENERTRKTESVDDRVAYVREKLLRQRGEPGALPDQVLYRVPSCFLRETHAAQDFKPFETMLQMLDVSVSL